MQLYKPAIQNQNTASYIHTRVLTQIKSAQVSFFGGKEYYNDTEQRFKAQVYNVVDATAKQVTKAANSAAKRNSAHWQRNLSSANNMAARDWQIAKHQIQRIRTIDV
jgi:hypothetical protein